MRIRDLWVRELGSSDLMRVFYVNTRENIADFFTKVIPTVHFTKIVLTLSGYSDILHVAPEATLSENYVAPATSDENVSPSEDVPL